MTEDFPLVFAPSEANLRKASAINKTVVFDALATAKITRLTAEFDGEGDSGGITSIDAVNGDQNVRLPAIKVPYQTAGWNGETLHAPSISLRRPSSISVTSFSNKPMAAGKTTKAPMALSSSR